MLKISDALADIVQDNILFQFGLQQGIFNLSQLAEYLLPHIELKTKKEVTNTAVLMALSRLQKTMKHAALTPDIFAINTLTIRSSLSAFTFDKSKLTQKKLDKLAHELLTNDAIATMTYGTTQLTIIAESVQDQNILKTAGIDPLYYHNNVNSIGISFNEEYIKVPGFIYVVLQQLLTQQVNLVEIASTYTELTLYVDQQDMKRTFEALQYLFKKKQ